MNLNCNFQEITFDGDFSPETFDRFVMVGEVVFDVIDVDSMVVKEENVLNRLLRLLENDMEPSVIQSTYKSCVSIFDKKSRKFVEFLIKQYRSPFNLTIFFDIFFFTYMNFLVVKEAPRHLQNCQCWAHEYQNLYDDDGNGDDD